MTGPDLAFDAALQATLDGKTKPQGALGRIEEVAAVLARVQHSLTPRAETCRHVIFAADHGIAAEGVSAYPQAVTREMVKNFLAGGAAANVFARRFGVDLAVVDAGIAGVPLGLKGLIDARIGAGTANALTGPAMTADDCARAIDAGALIAGDGTSDAASFGEMGIGNTSSAALVAAKLTGVPVADYVGRGTGLDDAGLEAKADVLNRAAARTEDRLEARVALAEYGGFEIAMMAGAMAAAAEQGQLVIVDGFIATVAAACAMEFAPGCERAMIFAHLSAEPGHTRLCDAIDVRPLLHLDMRLGEGTGALLCWPLVQAAAAMLCDMASFDSAGVSGKA
ncbi:MAG: nicotinate-nucleotide--dimethylbenzimidazole phosphoribosyltransferase [Rhodobacteraceae bacterium]|nr:nicotinate-nucleotide--dimethylbenzimidazole phosphoribosyltransferase [Paracoccaceae bacterium]NNK65796.1 nicotinate-nucleotide--dimethylbenzimidazole phosphoribosyltransferase [Paracoccaceae bacterium]